LGFKAVFQTVAPFLAQTAQLAVPGPLGNIAAGILTKVAGKDVKPEELQEHLAELAQTPDGLLKLKQAEEAYQIQASQLGFNHEDKIAELDAGDRDSARKMQVANKSWVPPTIAVLFVAGFFVTMGLKMAKMIPADQTISDLLTTLRDGLMLILAYYFGSSHGSDRKTELLAQAQPVKQ
jgi:hypothetical protein